MSIENEGSVLVAVTRLSSSGPTPTSRRLSRTSSGQSSDLEMEMVTHGSPPLQ